MDTPDVPGQSQPGQPQPGELQTRRMNELTIIVTCSAHGARGFCNLRITKVGREITLDPHVAGGCVIVLDEIAASAVFDMFGEWLG